jgi:hypothetical protein
MKETLNPAERKPATVPDVPNEEKSNGGMEAHVLARAYELYEQRGRQDGYAIEDWLQAEQELRGMSRGRLENGV